MWFLRALCPLVIGLVLLAPAPASSAVAHLRERRAAPSGPITVGLSYMNPSTATSSKAKGLAVGVEAGSTPPMLKQIMSADAARAVNIMSRDPLGVSLAAKNANAAASTSGGSNAASSSGTSTSPADGSNSTGGPSGSSTGSSETENATTVSATNVVVSYLARIEIGSGQTYDLILDTGSSNTWVGASTAYQQSSTTNATGFDFSVTYGSGTVSGTEVTDTIKLAGNLAITQSMGAATVAQGFTGSDGILGVGPPDLTLGTLSEGSIKRNATVSTVVDNLFSQGLISEPTLGVSFASSTGESASNGRITFGGVDASSFVGDLSWIPRTDTYPANLYWGVNLSISAGSAQVQDNVAGIMDTGTTLIMLSSDAFGKYMADIPNARIDATTTGLLEIPASSVGSIPDLVFMFQGGANFTMTPEEQLLPADQNEVFGGSTDMRYGYVASLGTPGGQGLDFIMGQKFLENFYTAYASRNGSVGIAASVRSASDANATTPDTLSPATGNGSPASSSGTGVVVVPGRHAQSQASSSSKAGARHWVGLVLTMLWASLL